MKFTTRTLLIITTAIAILLAIGGGVWRVKTYVEESILDSYRLESAGELFLDYRRKTGNWPSDWKSLEHHYHADANKIPLYACKSFDDLKNRIDIDFSVAFDQVDTTTVWSDDNPQLQIFISKTGQTCGPTFNPNRRIYSELQREAEKMRPEP